jgi:hypothetical protein
MVFAYTYQLSSGLGQRHPHMFGASTETIVARRVADLRLENRLSNVRDGMMCLYWMKISGYPMCSYKTFSIDYCYASSDACYMVPVPMRY